MIVDTRQLILDKSEVLVRRRGYAAFSYGDLAIDLGITKASVHYHFAAKEDLILAILQRCLERGRATLAQILLDHSDVRDRLRAYADGFVIAVESGMLPVCAALAAERIVLPPSTYPLIAEFFQIQFDWLEDVIAKGTAEGILAPPQSPAQAAIVLYSALEGGTMIAWGMDRNAVVLTAFEAILDCMMVSKTQTSGKQISTRTQTSPAVGKRQRQGQTGPRKRAASRSAAQAGGPLK